MTTSAWLPCRLKLALFVLVLVNLPGAHAQWLKIPSKGVPRTADGKPNLSAPVPKTADGRADVTGIWYPGNKYVTDIAKDLKKEDIPFRPWALELYKSRLANLSKDDPSGHCVPGGVPRSDVVPYPFKIMNADGEMLILYEAVHSYRQIFMDGRTFPKDPNPTWMGYSVGKWDGDTLVIDTTGFVDNSWIDNNGMPGTESMHVTERFIRRDFGHMDVRVTIDDPKAYTKPWQVTFPLELMPDTELLEYVCNENNKDVEHLVGK